jgi:hypothetical protein
MAEELTLDQQLETYFGTTENAATPAAAPEGEGKTPPAVQPVEAASPQPAPETPVEDPLLKALEGIEEEAAPKPEEPKPQVPEVLQLIPDVETAKHLRQIAENHANFGNAFLNGQYADVEAMFTNWNKQAFDGFLEHVYKQKVASGEWVDRYIKDNENPGGERVNTEIARLEREINALKSQGTQRQQTEQQEQARARDNATFKAFEDHVEGLFDGIKFNKADRKYVVPLIKEAVGKDPKLMTALKSGNTKAVNGVFKAAVREYVTRDKAQAAETQGKIDAQTQHKPPLGGGAGQEQSTIPDDLNQVKPEERENWMSRKLNSFLGIK